MQNLPFTPDPNYDHILTDEDRKRFAPKLATDEYWRPISCQWRPVEVAVHPFEKSIFYRRRKSLWISVEESPAVRPCWVYYGNAANFPQNRGPVFRVTQSDLDSNKTYTHWYPVKLEKPAPPQPPQPAEEVAFEEWWESEYALCEIEPEKKEMALTGFLAAINWAKANKEVL